MQACGAAFVASQHSVHGLLVQQQQKKKLQALASQQRLIACANHGNNNKQCDSLLVRFTRSVREIMPRKGTFVCHCIILLHFVVKALLIPNSDSYVQRRLLECMMRQVAVRVSSVLI